MESLMNFIHQTGFYMLGQGNWDSVIMVLLACVLLYLAIVKKFEPLLLLPIAFGMLLTNLIGAEVYHEISIADRVFDDDVTIEDDDEPAVGEAPIVPDKGDAR